MALGLIAIALLLHGFPGTPAELRPLGQALAFAGVRAQAPLLPGFGPAMQRLGDVGAREWLAARRFDGPVQLHELDAGHLLLDSTASGWAAVRELIVSFAAP